MTIKELEQFAGWANQQLIERFNRTDKEKRVLSHALKLSEELGELSSAVLASFELQRTEKLEARLDGNLNEEFADVLITTLVLASEMNVDIESALEKKMRKIRTRFE